MILIEKIANYILKFKKICSSKGISVTLDKLKIFIVNYDFVRTK